MKPKPFAFHEKMEVRQKTGQGYFDVLYKNFTNQLTIVAPKIRQRVTTLGENVDFRRYKPYRGKLF